MGTIQLLLGKTRARRRTAINRNWLTGLDPAGRPNFLYVTDTVRKRDLVAREFVRYRAGASFSPEVTTVSGLLADLHRRHGDGRVPWSRLGVQLVAEQVVQEQAHRWPALARMGEDAGAALADLHARWDEAGQPALDGARGGALQPLLAILHAKLADDEAAITGGDALRALVPRLTSPDDALASWLSRPHAVVIDDVLHPSPARRAVISALAEAWRAFGAHVLLCFESGRDLGGGEAASFFEYDDAAPAAFSLRPFAATRAWRRQLFAELVAVGAGADIVLAGTDGGLAVVDGTEPVVATEPPDLADRLYTDLPGGADLAGVRLVCWPAPEAEIRGIAHEVKARLRAGASPDDLWVAFPGLPGWLGLVRRVFTELGIPYESSSGTPVGTLPLARWWSAVLRVAAEGFPLGRVIEAVGSPNARILGAVDAARLGRWGRERGVTGGLASSWPEAPPLSAATQARLAEALADLGPLAAPLPALAWRDTLHGILARWQVVEALEAEVDSPEAGAGAAGALAARTLAGLGRVITAIDEVATAAHAASAGEWSPLRLADALDDALAATAIPDHPVDAARVQVVGMLELRGIHPRHLWIGGLLADDFPPRPPDHWLLPRDERAPLDEPDPGQEARYLLASALRNAQARREGSLVLSWSATREGRPVAVSPLVEDILDLPLGDGPDAGTVKSRVEKPGAPAEPASAEELDELLGAADALGRGSEGWDPAGPDPRPLAVALASRRDVGGFDAFDGVLARPPALPAKLGVTAFETYLGCPSRYFHGRVLGLRPEEPWDPDLPPPARGALLHRILRRFLAERAEAGAPRLEGTGDHTSPTLAATRAHLHAVARAEIAEDTRAGALSEGLGAHYAAMWGGGLVDDAPPGVLYAWLDVERSTTWGRTPEATEQRIPPYQAGPLTLDGVIDRIDRLDDGTPLIIDYKTGRAPTRDKVTGGLAIQGLLYLDAVAPEDEGASVYQEIGRASRVSHTGWAGSPDVVRQLAPRDKKRVEVDGPARARHREAWAAAAERIANGVFHPTLAGPGDAGCEYCDFRRSCRVDHERNASIRAVGDDRWQAPQTEEDPS